MAKSLVHAAVLDHEVKKRNVRQAQNSLDVAIVAERAAKRAVSDAAQARERLEDTKKLIVDTQERISCDKKYAVDIVKVLIGACQWNGLNDETEIAGYIFDLVPVLSWESIFNLAQEVRWYSNKEAANLLGVTYDTRQRLGLCQFRACDLTCGEFLKRQADRTKQRNKEYADAKRRIEGKPTSDERKANNAAKKAYLESLAFAEGKSVDTVRRYIKAGKLPEYAFCKSGVATNNTINSDATFASAQAASAHQARSKPSVEYNDENWSDALTGLRPDACRLSSTQKNTPAVSDKGITKYNIHDLVNNTLRLAAEAATSAPIYIERVLQNTTSACEQYAAEAKRRSANG